MLDVHTSATHHTTDRSPCSVRQYFIILLVLFVVLLVGGILGYVFNERVEDTITTTMMGELDGYSTRQDIKDAWDAAQMQVSSDLPPPPAAEDCPSENEPVHHHRMAMIVRDENRNRNLHKRPRENRSIQFT